MIKAVCIKDREGDLKKRWYVEYREFNPESNTWLRRREFGQVNRAKDPVRRRELIEELYAEILASLGMRLIKAQTGDPEIKRYIESYLADKATTLRKASIKNIRLSLRYFYQFLKARGLHTKPLQEIKKQDIHEFRLVLCKATGNRSVNNHISFVRSFFNYFVNNYDDILYKNPAVGISKLPEVSETHVAYTPEQKRAFWTWMEERDPELLLFCQFIGLGFVRCDEARYVKVGDIDFQTGKLVLWGGNSKTRRRTVTTMLKTFFDILIRNGIHNHPKDYFVFSRDGKGKPGQVMVGYNYFRKKFRKLKAEFGLDRRYSIYGFRHTTVSNMLENNAPWRETMKYTRHTTMAAFERYQRSLGAKPARDLSEYVDI